MGGEGGGQQILVVATRWPQPYLKVLAIDLSRQGIGADIRTDLIAGIGRESDRGGDFTTGDWELNLNHPQSHDIVGYWSKFSGYQKSTMGQLIYNACLDHKNSPKPYIGENLPA